MTITKLEHVKREVCRIAGQNSNQSEFFTCFAADKLRNVQFNRITGRHELECFFGIAVGITIAGIVK